MTTMLNPPSSPSPQPGGRRGRTRTGTPDGAARALRAAGAADTAQAPSAEDAAAILTGRYTADEGAVHLTGIQALVRMIRDRAIADRAAGLATSSFVSGYEGSPLGGYDLELARRRTILAPYDVRHVPAVNEELGATAVAGSQFPGRGGGAGTLRDGVDGVVGYWYGKAPGLDRSADALRHANLSGTSPTGGAVAIVGDDPAAKSSTVPSNSEGLLADLGLPVLVPADAGEALRLGMHAAWLSRASGLWTALRVTTAVADGSATVDLSGLPAAPAAPDGERHAPTARLLGQTLHVLEASRVGPRMDRARAYIRDHGLNRVLHAAPGDRVGVVCAGAPALAVEEALRDLGSPAGVRVLRLGVTWPLDADEVAVFADGLDAVIVAEDRGSFLSESLRAVLYATPHRPRILAGPADGLPRTGAVTAADVAAVIRGACRDAGVPVRETAAAGPAGRTRPRGPRSLPLAVAARAPHFCSGCPHNASIRVTGESLVGAGIGCHAMVLLMDPDRVGDVTGTAQMGGEGLHWVGMSPFVEERHYVQNLGDGTFLHSGSLAIRALVAAGVDCTVKLLHNGTVAMTGGQDPVGQKPLAGMLDILRAEGVSRIVVTTDDVARTRRALPRGTEVRDRADLADVQRELAAESGVTVLVHDQHCAAEKRRARKRGKAETPATRVVINERICEGCGDCGAKSGCLSVQPVDTEFGRKTRIDQSTCNVDCSCLSGDCPAFVTVTPKGARAARPTAPPLDAAALPAPPAPAPRDGSFGVRVTGVGGTGVVTLAAVLATAAQLDGGHVRGTDMTGLAQKGGSVVSDVRIAAAPLEEPGTVPAGGADLLIACDGLTTAEPGNLAVIDPGRTVAVVSSTDNPTGAMCVDVAATRPDGVALAGAIGRSAARAVTLDAAGLSLRLFGDGAHQTMLLLGAAVQTGALPVTPEAVEQAIAANGVAVDANTQAFRRGRQLVADPVALECLTEDLDPAPEAPEPPRWAVDAAADALDPRAEGVPDPDVVAHVALRAAELADWGSRRDADGFLTDIARIAAAERAAAPGSTELTVAASFGLHKLTAVKDEYEVARLALDDAFADQVAAEHGDGADVRAMLHPPFLRAMGMTRKMAVGRAGRVALRALSRMKGLRGTPLDVFGRAHVRRVDREVLAEYRAALLDAADGLDAEGLPRALEIAGLADGVRGYEDVRLRTIGAFRSRLAELTGDGAR
ncbi:indolepyruvate ferredoxin oxidoreductase family protein [Corynebacterium sp. 335C]